MKMLMRTSILQELIYQESRVFQKFLALSLSSVISSNWAMTMPLSVRAGGGNTTSPSSRSDLATLEQLWSTPLMMSNVCLLAISQPL